MRLFVAILAPSLTQATELTQLPHFDTGWAKCVPASEQSWLASVEDWHLKCTCAVWGGFGDPVWLWGFS